MIRLKKKKQAAEEEAARDVAMPDAPVDSEPGKVSILGIGGKKVGKGTTSKKRKTPGEIRIQKDIAELDGGDVATIKFPNANDLTKFNASRPGGQTPRCLGDAASRTSRRHFGDVRVRGAGHPREATRVFRGCRGGAAATTLIFRGTLGSGPTEGLG